MTCEDCIYFPMCRQRISPVFGEQCENFSDRSLWVDLPCRVGDILYEPTDRGTISEYEVLTVRVELFSTFVEYKIKDENVWKYVHEINSNEIGKAVFRTREEAKRALKERESNEK